MTAHSVTPEVLAAAAMRRDLNAFLRPVFRTLHPGQSLADHWYLRALTHGLMQAGHSETSRLLITIPPRYLKSICGAVAFPAWMLARDPSLKFLVASYSSELSLKHARDFRTIMESAWFRQSFPHVGDLKRTTDGEIVTQQNGRRQAISLGGSVTGFGANILIIDDLMKAADANSAVERQRVKDFYTSTLFSRLDDKQHGRIIAIQQRLHEDDLAGFLIERGNFTHINLRAIAEEDEDIPIGVGRVHRRLRGEALCPEREPVETLAEIRVEMGAPIFSAQYQQNPVSMESALIRWDRFHFYGEAPSRERCARVVQSWDTAMTAGPNSDFSVCTTWGFHEGSWLLLDLYRDRLEYPDLKVKVLELARSWRADTILVEDAGSGIPLIQDLMIDMRRRRSGDPAQWFPRAYRPDADKQTRLSSQATKLEEGVVLLPTDAPWLPDLKRELLSFPQSKHDDQVDSVSQFLAVFGHTQPTTGRRQTLRRDHIRARG